MATWTITDQIGTKRTRRAVYDWLADKLGGFDEDLGGRYFLESTDDLLTQIAPARYPRAAAERWLANKLTALDKEWARDRAYLRESVDILMTLLITVGAVDYRP